MVNRNDNKYRYKKHLSLKDDLDASAYFTAIVENTKRKDCGKDSKAEIKLSFENLYNYIAVCFDIEFPDQQKAVLKKISELEKMLKKFRKAIEKEAELQNKRAYKPLKAKKLKNK